MTAISIESLGISKDELVGKLLDRLVEDFTTEPTWDEDGSVSLTKNTMAKQITAQIKMHIDQTVQKLGEKHVLPRVTEIVEGLVIQQTNQWGEKTGAPVTFIEYLTSRADHYMREDVDYEGKTKSEARDNYGWRKTGTRVSFMIDKHLHNHIETAMKAALADANSSISGGLLGAVKIALANATEKLKVDVKTK
jgi:hypothetical protein